MKTGPKCGGVVWSGVAEFRGAEDAQPAADDTRMKYRRSMGRIGGNKSTSVRVHEYVYTLVASAGARIVQNTRIISIGRQQQQYQHQH